MELFESHGIIVRMPVNGLWRPSVLLMLTAIEGLTRC